MIDLFISHLHYNPNVYSINCKIIAVNIPVFPYYWINFDGKHTSPNRHPDRQHGLRQLGPWCIAMCIASFEHVHNTLPLTSSCRLSLSLFWLFFSLFSFFLFLCIETFQPSVLGYNSPPLEMRLQHLRFYPFLFSRASGKRQRLFKRHSAARSDSVLRLNDNRVNARFASAMSPARLHISPHTNGSQRLICSAPITPPRWIPLSIYRRIDEITFLYVEAKELLDFAVRFKRKKKIQTKTTKQHQPNKQKSWKNEER